MPACCIAYTADQSYLFPTLVSAVQARRHACADKADIIILGVDIDARAQREFAAICAEEDIGFMAVSPDAIGGHTAMMARLYLDRLLPDQYSQILYIDGDTQVTASLAPLIEAQVSAGGFLAANDPMTFTLDAGIPAPGMRDGAVATARAFARHARSIGMSASQSRFYFNTGVLRINRSGWDAIGQAAIRLIVKNQGAFRFPDQDPLNVVGADRHIPMSLAWNFPIFMCNAAVVADISPAIYHFMSQPKPWQGGFLPWRLPGAQPYGEAIRRHPVLAAYNPHFPLHARLRYHVQQRFKASLETLTWRMGARRQRILQYERQLAPLAGG